MKNNLEQANIQSQPASNLEPLDRRIGLAFASMFLEFLDRQLASEPHNLDHDDPISLGYLEAIRDMHYKLLPEREVTSVMDQGLQTLRNARSLLA